MTKRIETIPCYLFAGIALLSLIETAALAGVNGKAGPAVAGAPEPLALSSSGPSASVNANGLLANGHGIVSSARLSTGNYEVITNRLVVSCAYIATIGNPGSLGGGVASTGQITTALRSGNPNGVFIQTTDSAGT